MNTESERKNVNYMIVDTFIQKITPCSIALEYMYSYDFAKLTCSEKK
jgi:hypothetical protein